VLLAYVDDMYDLEIHFSDEPGQLARIGEALGAAGHSIDGGGMWVVGGRGVARFLFADGAGAQAVLEAGLDCSVPSSSGWRRSCSMCRD